MRLSIKKLIFLKNSHRIVHVWIY